MYYKVLKNNKVVDVLDKIIYLKYQPKHNMMILSNSTEAQAILSSDNNTVWHERTLNKVPVGEYETVDVVAIDEIEYRQLKVLNMKTPEEIIDEYNLLLLEMGVL